MTLCTFTPAGTGTDILDMVHDRCHGEILRIDDVGQGGETDHLAQGLVSARDVRRLRAAGLVHNARGCRADQLAHVANWTGTADEFVAWYVETCIVGLDMRAESRTGTAWHELVRPDDEHEGDDAPLEVLAPAPAGDLPTAVVEYLVRLVHLPKAEYAGEYAYHAVFGHPCPADPGTDWAGKVRHRIDAIVRRSRKGN